MCLWQWKIGFEFVLPCHTHPTDRLILCLHTSLDEWWPVTERNARHKATDVQTHMLILCASVVAKTRGSCFHVAVHFSHYSEIQPESCKREHSAFFIWCCFVLFKDWLTKDIIHRCTKRQDCDLSWYVFSLYDFGCIILKLEGFEYKLKASSPLPEAKL